jgi:outer membrane protein OmpA-like peptidoglycan-associated protein
MLINRFKAICLIACFTILSGLAAAQVTAPNITNVPDGQKIKVLGIITNRAEESFVVTTPDRAANYVVNLLPDTSVKTYDAGIFRVSHRYASSFLLRGLQVMIEGRGNTSGAINATDVRFKEVDLRAAQSLNTVLAPVESQVASNTDRITANEANDQLQQGQIMENNALTARAQATADNAQLAADRANNRINGLDEYEPIKTINVPFETGKFRLNPKAEAVIDEAAAWIKTQNTKGWMVSVVGFADSTGSTAANKTLSERRADAVIDYLVTMYNLPLAKLVQPFGAGVNSPIATNDTAEGRAQNRRVEIRLLLNKSIADK